MEGFSDDDLKSIAGRPVDFTALAKLALAHSDGVIIHTETVAQELLDFIEENKIPCLPYEAQFRRGQICRILQDIIKSTIRNA